MFLDDLQDHLDDTWPYWGAWDWVYCACLLAIVVLCFLGIFFGLITGLTWVE